MKKLRKIFVTAFLTSTLIISMIQGAAFASSPRHAIPQGVSPKVVQKSKIYGNLNPSTMVTIDVVMKTQNKNQLAQYIHDTVTPGNPNYRKYLTVDQFKKQFAPQDNDIKTVTDYLNAFHIQTKVYPDNLVITATGKAEQFNQAFRIALKDASYTGKRYHLTKNEPSAPQEVAQNILCILGLTNYSDLKSNSVKRVSDANVPQGPLNLTPSDLIKQYHVQPLYDQGATGEGQTIGIVTLAEFNPSDAYAFWKNQNITVKPNRIKLKQVDGGSDWNGYDETSLDVEQSGALAPQANINVYVGPNSDTGFVDAFASAINENQAQQISVSWGESETVIDLFTSLQLETPQYAESFNQLFMEAAAQGISMFAASGDAGSYDAARELIGSNLPGTYGLSVDNPADDPYITAAGGTTLPMHLHSSVYNFDVTVAKERAWGWDYLYPYFDARGLYNPNSWTMIYYFLGGGGGFSNMFKTPAYQKGVAGVNSFTAAKQWTPNSDASAVTRDSSSTIVSGTGSGRNIPDLSMNADPYTGYLVYFSDPGQPGSHSGYSTYGGTSFVSPQLCGLTALINSADHTKVGFWNGQIYRFAQQTDSPFTPLNSTGTSNDNIYFTGTPGTIYNQATGLGTPDVAKLAQKFAGHH